MTQRIHNKTSTMRIILLIFILFWFAQPTICSAQNSFPTLADHPKWRVSEYLVVWPPVNEYFIDYTLEKDTILNDLNYSIVVRSDSSFNVPKSYRIGYTRTLGQKVYFKFIDGREFMIYDFSLNVGESSYCYMCDFGLDKYTALKVDTIAIEGIKRKRIQVDPQGLSGFLSPFYWIEGIGSNYNPFFHYCSGVQDKLRCLTTSSGTIYMNPKYTDCETLSDITSTSKKISEDVHSKEQYKIVIYPNPATNRLIISNQSRKLENMDIKLFDTNGSLIYTNKVNQSTHEIDVSKIPAGYYLIQIITDKWITQQKIIKQ